MYYFFNSIVTKACEWWNCVEIEIIVEVPLLEGLILVIHFIVIINNNNVSTQYYTILVYWTLFVYLL